jgi:hypothetical protein
VVAAAQFALLVAGSLALNYGFLWKRPWLAVLAGFILAAGIACERFK